MFYCTRQDLINAYGEEELIQLTDRIYAGSIDELVLNQAIAIAQAEIDVWLTGSFKLPLPSVPLVLVMIACDFTRYLLSGDIGVDHHVAVRRRDQLATLKAISRGQISLGLDQSGEVTSRVDLVQIASGRNDFGDRSRW
ncbi:MAG: DUF1320 domain-containing protein [Undibacterium sp.]|nr:DUF1320 domain-containing protein [Undibacterium sp.]